MMTQQGEENHRNTFDAADVQVAGATVDAIGCESEVHQGQSDIDSPDAAAIAVVAAVASRILSHHPRHHS